MQPHELDPPAALQTVIRSFWHLRLDVGAPSAPLEILPDGYAEIIFYVGGACSRLGPTGWQPLPSPFLVGLLQQPLLLRPQGRLDILGVRCFPWTVFELLGLPPGQDDVRSLPPALAQLQAPLARRVQAGQVAEALAHLAQYFAQAHPLPGRDPVLAGGAMQAASGTLPVSQVAAAAHATVRTLERKFKQAAGYTVKDVSGLMRFEQVRDHLCADPAASLAGLAQQLGYADQSHLGREFKRYSGTTPAAFARKAQRARLVAGSDFVAFMLA